MGITIYIDADACPVRQESYRVAERHQTPVIIVSNSYLRIPKHPLFSGVIVDDSFDAADDYIAERANNLSVVITADILLAQRCLMAGARVLAPNGKAFDNNSIGSAIAGAIRKLHSAVFPKQDTARKTIRFTLDAILSVNLKAYFLVGLANARLGHKHDFTARRLGRIDIPDERLTRSSLGIVILSTGLAYARRQQIIFRRDDKRGLGEDIKLIWRCRRQAKAFRRAGASRKRGSRS